MSQTPREIVTRCLTFDYPARLPRELWAIPYAFSHYRSTIEEIYRRFPSDFAGTAGVYRPASRARGDMYAVGSAVDDWGCRFVNIQAGVHGEVKKPVISDGKDWRRIKPPYETLPANRNKARDAVNRSCAATDRFVRAGCCPRPWERYQFLRGTENAMLDVMDPGGPVRNALRVIHEFHLKELEFWVTTDVDAVIFMDDWGAQNQLLIPPRLWRQLFKPLYREYCDLIRGHGKFVFMHSDGHIAEVYDDLVEIGVQALNSQLFCMDMADLARRAKGKLTFWGEMDRQHVLPAKDPAVGRRAVREVARHFYDPAGGVIAQFELSAGSNPATAIAIYEEWERVDREARGRRHRAPARGQRR